MAGAAQNGSLVSPGSGRSFICMDGTAGARTRSLPITSGFYGCGEGFANPVNADRQGGVQEGETDQAFCRRAQLMLMRVSQMTPRPTQRRMPRWPL